MTRIGRFFRFSTRFGGEEAVMLRPSNAMKRARRGRDRSAKQYVVEAPPRLIMLMIGLGMLAGAIFTEATRVSGNSTRAGVDGHAPSALVEPAVPISRR